MEKKLFDRQPNMQLVIEVCQPICGPELPGSLFVLGVRVTNAGQPSVVTGWSGTYRVASSTEPLYARNVGVIGALILRHRDEAIDLTNEHLITHKTAIGRIETFDIRTGRLCLELMRDASGEVSAGSYEITVRCFDGSGAQVEANYSPQLGSGGGGMISYPGETVYSFPK